VAASQRLLSGALLLWRSDVEYDLLYLIGTPSADSDPEYLELTEPPMWAPTIDAEVDVRETTDTGGRSAISGAPAQGYATNRCSAID
jgi:hypothetical protein